MSQPNLRPQDVFVLAKLIAYAGPRPPIAQVGLELSLSASQVHAALKRLLSSRLVSKDGARERPILKAVEEFLIHGLKYVFPARRGEMTRGVPTSYAAPPLCGQISSGTDPPPVWPYAEGDQRGVSLEPLYKTVPAAALRDPALYELLALIDALRDGRARERQIGQRELLDRLRHTVR